MAVVLPHGRTSFQQLQQVIAHRSDRASLVYFVVDLLRLDRNPLDHLPLDVRKAQLQSLTQRQANGRIRYADHVVGPGATFFDLARRHDLDGIVSKRRDLPYHGGRDGE
jgi:bifunctional non-homologous end joining protein LigD